MNQVINASAEGKRSFFRTLKFTKDQNTAINQKLKTEGWVESNESAKRFLLHGVGFTLIMQNSINAKVITMTIEKKKVNHDEDEDDDAVILSYKPKILVVNSSIDWPQINGIKEEKMLNAATTMVDFLLAQDDLSI